MSTLLLLKELYKSDRELRELVTQLLTSESSLKAQLVEIYVHSFCFSFIAPLCLP